MISSKMANVLPLVAFLLSCNFPAIAQDTTTDRAGPVLREYVDKGYCTYTYVVPPGSGTGACSPSDQSTSSTEALERQLAKTKEEMDNTKNQVVRQSSMLQNLLARMSNLTSELSEEKIKSAGLEQNLTKELQERDERLQATRNQLEQNFTQALQVHEANLDNLRDNLAGQLSAEKSRSEGLERNLTKKLEEQDERRQAERNQMEQNFTQALLVQEAKLVSMLNNLSAQLVNEKARGNQLEQSLQDLETSLQAHIACDWKLVFRIVPGVDQNSYTLWSRATTPSDMPEDPSLAGQGHYRSRDLDVWETLDIKQVKLSLYTFSPTAETRDIIFNGTGSDKFNWFSMDRLISSPWCDLKTEPTNYFSIRGFQYFVHYGSWWRSDDRRFYIAQDAVCSNSRGWLVVLQQDSNNCGWQERVTGDPVILFSKLSGNVNFDQDWTNVGIADAMAIFIKSCND